MIVSALRRLAWPLMLAVVLCGVLYLGAFPVRTYLGQRRTTAVAETRLAELDRHNAEMQAQVDRLSSDAEIERIAREQYGLAKPGEEVYHVLPAPQDPAQPPDAWPFELLRTRLREGTPTGN